MSYRKITLPEPPPMSAMAGVPEIFEKGISTAVRRAVIIGNGAAGAEHQCLGLVRALGLGNRFQLHRIERPRGSINDWLRWLPLSLHRGLDTLLGPVFTRLYFEFSRLELKKYLRQKTIVSPPPDAGHSKPSSDSLGQPAVQVANAQAIADMANQEVDCDGPLLVVAAGRDTVGLAAAVKRLAPLSTFVVQIQNPRCDTARFDMVVTPQHDYHALAPAVQDRIPVLLRHWMVPSQPPDKHVVLTVGALHHADSLALRTAAATWHAELAYLPKPLVIVNIGGSNRYCRYGDDMARQLAHCLRQTLVRNGGCARVSFSRRTPLSVQRIIKEELAENPVVHIWDGRGANPHLGHLAWGDAFVVTADSVSMLSEACSTGKPVYVAGGELCTWKFLDFQRSLRKRGATRPFTGNENLAESWSYPPLRDNEEVAEKVHQALAERGWNS